MPTPPTSPAPLSDGGAPLGPLSLQGPARLRLDLPDGRWHEIVLVDVIVSRFGAGQHVSYAVQGSASAEAYDADVGGDGVEQTVRRLARCVLRGDWSAARALYDLLPDHADWPRG